MTRAITYAIAPCRLGLLLVAATERGLCHVRFADTPEDLQEALRAEFPWARRVRDDAALRMQTGALVAAVDGAPLPVSLVLDVRGSRFQRRVWDALRAIPRGATRSYGEIAAGIGRPGAARAVARACATNPVALAIPCHRVTPRSGGAGGYRWGTWRKRALLEREAAEGEAPDVVAAFDARPAAALFAAR
jgi:AraC family transcriptional regulator of adaptative response/methylated-DNA-[protein]-cysteine methyltransferase